MEWILIREGYKNNALIFINTNGRRDAEKGNRDRKTWSDFNPKNKKSGCKYNTPDYTPWLLLHVEWSHHERYKTDSSGSKLVSWVKDRLKWMNKKERCSLFHLFWVIFLWNRMRANLEFILHYTFHVWFGSISVVSFPLPLGLLHVFEEMKKQNWGLTE